MCAAREVVVVADGIVGGQRTLVLVHRPGFNSVLLRSVDAEILPDRATVVVQFDAEIKALRPAGLGMGDGVRKRAADSGDIRLAIATNVPTLVKRLIDPVPRVGSAAIRRVPQVEVERAEGDARHAPANTDAEVIGHPIAVVVEDGLQIAVQVKGVQLTGGRGEQHILVGTVLQILRPDRQTGEGHERYTGGLAHVDDVGGQTAGAQPVELAVAAHPVQLAGAAVGQAVGRARNEPRGVKNPSAAESLVVIGRRLRAVASRDVQIGPR